MEKNNLIGKDLYHREDKIGEIIDLKRDPLGNREELLVIETSKNDLKLVPANYVEQVSNRYQLQSDRTMIDNFPALSTKEVENDSDKMKNALRNHFGSPDTWNRDKKAQGENHDQSYMGGNATHNQAPDGNKSLEGKMDYEKVKGISSGDDK